MSSDSERPVPCWRSAACLRPGGGGDHRGQAAERGHRGVRATRRAVGGLRADRGRVRAAGHHGAGGGSGGSPGGPGSRRTSRTARSRRPCKGDPRRRRERSSGPALSAAAARSLLRAAARRRAGEGRRVDPPGSHRRGGRRRSAARRGRATPRREVLLRSAAKPFQAAAVVESGAAEAFSLSDEEIAVIAASHAGAARARARWCSGCWRGPACRATALVCGPVEHMCSGKHAGMLLLARHLGVAVEGYEREEHPVQREMPGTSRRCSMPVRAVSPPDGPFGGGRPGGRWPRSRSLFAGTDGCGVPVIRTTLCEAAWLFALAGRRCHPGAGPGARRDAGPSRPGSRGERASTPDLMRAAPGRVVAKGGAEGVQGIGLLLARRRPHGRGWAASSRSRTGRAGRSLRWRRCSCGRGGWRRRPRRSKRDYPPSLLDGAGVEVGGMEVLVEHASLRRGDRPRERSGAGQARPGTPSSRRPGWRLFGGKDDRVTVCRGDEKDVLRFLREQWPAVDEEYFGRAVEWSAEPYALVYPPGQEDRRRAQRPFHRRGRVGGRTDGGGGSAGHGSGLAAARTFRGRGAQKGAARGSS